MTMKNKKLVRVPLTSLADELLLHILSYLDYCSLCYCTSSLNKRFYNLSNSNLLWKQLLKKDFNIDVLPKNQSSFKEAYRIKLEEKRSDVMIVRAIWGSSFWVECVKPVAERQIYPLLQDNNNRFGDEVRRGFLVSNDLKKIEESYYFYPYSGQWNAYNPFEFFDGDIIIHSLYELKKLPLDVEKLRKMATPTPKDWATEYWGGYNLKTMEIASLQVEKKEVEQKTNKNRCLVQ